MQRWALTLSGYQYDIMYRTSKNNAIADALSRLPVDNCESADPAEVPAVHLLAVENLPITSAMIAEATRKDVILSRVLDFTM